MEKERYKLTVEPITCVHIGTGEELNPLDYLLSENEKTGRTLYVVYDTDSILRRIAADKQKTAQFESISSNMASLVKFFHREFKADQDLKYTCSVTREFDNNYDALSNRDPLENGRFVQQMYRPAGSRYPVIPGSSIKGSVRTAVLNSLLDNYGRTAELRTFKDDKIQKTLLNNYKDAKQDPFRSVEIGDCEFETKGCQLVGAIKNVKYDRMKEEVVEHNTSIVQAEVIRGKLTYKQNPKDVSGNALVRINSALASEVFNGNGVTKKISVDEIIKSCNEFYLAQFKNEYDKFYKDSYSSNAESITELYKELKAIAGSESNTFILRVGRWSQVEFVTYEHELRNPKTPKKNGKIMPYGTTRWVFNNDGQYLPLGWCKCTLTPLED
jgi:CRISPR-associated protein Csm5